MVGIPSKLEAANKFSEVKYVDKKTVDQINFGR